MKILFYVRQYPPEVTGPGIYMHNMARALVAAGHQAVVITTPLGGQPTIITDDNITIYRTPHFGSSSHKKLASILKIIKDEHVDWIEGADHRGDAASLLSMKNRPPIVIKAHSCNVLRVLRNSLILYKWQKPLIALSILRNLSEYMREYKSLVQADMLLTPSKRMMDECIRQGLNLPQRRAVIPNPIGDSTDSPHWPVSGSPRKVLFIGRLDIGKGIQYLPAVANALEGSGAILRIVGADGYARGLGSLKKWLKDQFIGINTKVEFVGPVPPDSVPALMRESSVIILPSRWDNFPTVILEAMQHGRPVVASPYGGMEDMLLGTGCQVFDPGHEEYGREVRRLIDHPEEVERLGKNMHQKCMKDYSPVKVADDYIRIVTSKLGLSE